MKLIQYNQLQKKRLPHSSNQPKKSKPLEPIVRSHIVKGLRDSH